MPNLGAPSEFGGKPQRNGVQPPPHRPTPSERLSLMYRTGREDGTAAPDNGEAWLGLLPLDDQRALRETAGDLDKGQVWAEMQASGEA